MDNDTALLLTVKQVCGQLNLGRNTLTEYEKAGLLRPIHVGRPDARKRTLRYLKSDLLDFIGRQQS